MTPAPVFYCQICGEVSTQLCAYCTKDTCGNHLCEKCGRCSDCCNCQQRRFVEGAAAARTAE